jgi:hypothetical protein
MPRPYPVMDFGINASDFAELELNWTQGTPWSPAEGLNLALTAWYPLFSGQLLSLCLTLKGRDVGIGRLLPGALLRTLAMWEE